MRLDLIYSEIKMLPDLGDLSPDLEWMLQSGQVDERTLIAVLVRNYYPGIYQMALSRLAYPEEAQRVAAETFVQAVLNSSTYRGTSSVSDWLEEISIRIGDQQKVFLQDQELLNPQLIQSIRHSQESKDLSPLELENITREIKTKLQARKTFTRKTISLQVFGFLGIIGLVLLIMMGSRNLWTPGPADEDTASNLEVGNEQFTGKDLIRPQGIGQDEEASSIQPLSLNSSSDEIRERMMLSTQFWDTMWAEIVVTFHGPTGYIGPPFRERHQFWIDPQSGGMLVSGPLDGFPNFIDRFTLPADMDMAQGITWGDEYANIGSLWPWFTIHLETIIRFPYVLKYLGQNPALDGIIEVTYTPVGEQKWAGHQALIIDLIPETGTSYGRIYLEPETGIVLREQYYAPGSNRKIIIESSIKDLKINQPKPRMWKGPDNVFHPPRNFLQGHNTEDQNTTSWSTPTSPFDYRRAISPSNFDPSRSELVFIKSSLFDDQESETETYSIYADNIHLGEIDLPDPLRIMCTRSPDGNIIAYTNQTYFPAGDDNHIYWFDLRQLEITSIDLPVMSVQRISFSPDNRSLAISGYNEQVGKDQFIVLDTASNTTRLLPIPNSWNPISWTPDGNQIMVLEPTYTNHESGSQHIISFYAATDGQLIDQIQVNGLPADNITQQVPIEDWVAKFDLSIQDLTSCTIPEPED
ncbi:MAG: hypothetical protein ACK2UM_17145 [Anaerolineales bacterium]